MQKLRPFLLLALLLAVGIGFLCLPLRQWFLAWQRQIEGLGAIGPLVMALAYVLMTVLLIPGSALTIGASTLFGFWKGLAIVLFGANLGALCAFLLARTLLREQVSHCAEAHPKLAALDRAFESFEQAYEQRDGILVLLKHIARFIPGLSADPRLVDLLRRIGLPQ